LACGKQERAALGLKGISGTHSPASPSESRHPFDTPNTSFCGADQQLPAALAEIRLKAPTASACSFLGVLRLKGLKAELN